LNNEHHAGNRHQSHENDRLHESSLHKNRLYENRLGTTNRRSRHLHRYAGFFGVALLALVPASGQAQEKPNTLPPVNVEAPKNRAATRPQQTSTTRTTGAKRRVARSAKPPKPVVQVVDDGNGPNNNNSGPPLQQAPSLGKTGTKLADLPASVQIIPREVVTAQGGTLLRDAINNASGINSGGQDSLGYFDHFLIRGLNAQVYTDGFSDGDQLGGLVHSLNGVRRVEILEGPGSALFGSGPPGGTINIVHYDPSAVFHWGTSTQFGSFGTVTNSNYVTGPTTIPGLNYRIDTTFAGGEGFRDLTSQDYEVRPAFSWHTGEHTFNFALDARHIEQTPDAYGLIYLNGSPITGVPNTAKYSTPFSFAKQDDIRPTFTDQWDITNYLTINNRFSFTHREIDAMRNNDSMTAINSTSGTHIQVVNGVDELVGRQLRFQNDSDAFFDYQFEPVWKFYTGDIHHTLLTGFEYQYQVMDTNRVTANLPNINNIFAPVATENINALPFMCDSQHSCDNNHLVASYYGLYATDQMDLTDKWKLRLGVRQDWYENELDPLVTVPNATTGLPSAFTNTGVPIIAGVPLFRDDKPLSWNVGTLYHLTPWLAPYIGASQSYLTNFNSENTQFGIGKPESARQYEAGVRFSFLNERVVLNTAVFNVSRDNVATTIAGPTTGQDLVVFDSQLTNGVEASLLAKITDQWSLLANATHQDAVVTAAPQALTTIGNRPQGVPANMANVWSTYKFAIGGVPGFQVGLGANYRDKTYSDTTNVNWVPSYVIGNAMIGWENANWGFTLNVKNLTNQLYYVAANGAGGFVGEGLGAYLTVRYRQ
jgi:iron complex outermembrane receptor protein